MIDHGKIELLRQRAARHGALTTGDLREILPVDRMSADELALAVLQLEDAGVSIDIDEALMGSSRRRTPTVQHIPVIDLPGAQGASRDANSMRAAAPGLSPEAYRPSEPIYRAMPADAGTWKFVAAAGALIALGAIAVFLFSK